jgi:hypothetical protein
MTVFNERSGGDIQLKPATNGSVEVFSDATIHEGLNVGEFLIVTDDESLAAFNRLVTDGPLVFFQQDGAFEGTISVTGTTVSYGAFTGCHYGWTDRTIERGTLVVMTGENRRRTDDPSAEPTYGIAGRISACSNPLSRPLSKTRTRSWPWAMATCGWLTLDGIFNPAIT